MERERHKERETEDKMTTTIHTLLSVCRQKGELPVAWLVASAHNEEEGTGRGLGRQKREHTVKTR